MKEEVVVLIDYFFCVLCVCAWRCIFLLLYIQARHRSFANNTNKKNSSGVTAAGQTAAVVEDAVVDSAWFKAVHTDYSGAAAGKPPVLA